MAGRPDMKRILVMDGWLPQPDRDTGSRSNYQYLGLLNELGLSVFIMPDDGFRAEPYAEQIEKLGVRILAGQFFHILRSKWLRHNGDAFDYVLFRWPETTNRYMADMRLYSRARILYLAHDIQAVRRQAEYAATADPAVKEMAEEISAIEAHIFQNADVLMSFSHHETKMLQEQYGPKVFQIPLLLYADFPKRRTAPPQNHDLLFVGYFQHTPNVNGLLWFVHEVLPGLVHTHPDVRLLITGAYAPAELQALASKRVMLLGHVPDDGLEALYRQVRIAVAPLRFGAGVKGKVIEAAAWGTPIVTTGYGIEGMPMLERVIPPADTPEDMTAAIANLFDDDRLWLARSEDGQRYVSQYFATASGKKRMESILHWLDGGPSPSVLLAP